MDLEFMVGPTYGDPNESFGQKLSELVDHEDEFSEWEDDFLGHMVDMFEKGQNFTDAQIEQVNKMYEKYCY